MWTWSPHSLGVGRLTGLRALGPFFSLQTSQRWCLAAQMTSGAAPAMVKALANLRLDLWPVFSWSRLTDCLIAALTTIPLASVASSSSSLPDAWKFSRDATIQAFLNVLLRFLRFRSIHLIELLTFGFKLLLKPNHQSTSQLTRVVSRSGSDLGAA